jgi:TRAP-type mannitol/chloroaromatic compound transport system permease small subunit
MKEEARKIPAVCRVLDGIILHVGNTLSWLNVVLVLVILVQVILRYAFGKGMVSLEELQWHLYAVCIMFGLSYGIITDSHIRLDLLHRRFSTKQKEIVEFFGMLLLVMPMVLVLFLHGIDFVETSIRIGERSDSPLGLPYRWIIKSVVPVSMVFMAIAAISRMIRSVYLIFRKS